MTRDTLTMVLACLAAALIISVVGYGALKDAAATIKRSRADVDFDRHVERALANVDHNLAYDFLDELAARREQARRV